MTVEKPLEVLEDQSLYSRPYKSRRQRPCDFCRKRKSCCIIEGTLPCKLCRTFKRECTFLEGPITRPKPKVDENGQRIVSRKRSSSSSKTETRPVTNPKRRRGRKPKVTQDQNKDEIASKVVTSSPVPTTENADLKAIDPLLTKVEMTRRYTVLGPDPKESKKYHDLEIFNVQQDMIVGNNDILLQDLHYSLEDHDNSTMMPNTNNGNWKNVFGYIIDSPLLQPARLNELSKTPLTLSDNVNNQTTNGIADVVYTNQFLPNNSSSSADSQISSLPNPADSVGSIDSPKSSISGSIHLFNSNSKTLSGFQFNRLYSSHTGQFISSLLQADSNNKYGNFRIESLKDNHGINSSTGGMKRMIGTSMGYQREIFNILECYGDKLISLYLTYVNPFMPILSKSQINAIFNNGQFTRNSVVSNLKKMDLALIASIIASALEYWDLDPELILDESPSASKMSDVAFSLIFSEFELRNYLNSKIALDLLQSSLILGIKCSFDITKLDELHRIDDLKKLISISHSIIIELGLNVDQTKHATNVHVIKEDQGDQIFRDNLWWCFYIEEKWLSFLIGQQSVIEEQDPDVAITIQTPSGILSNFPSQLREFGADLADYESLLKNSACYFEGMIKLTLILSGVSKNFYKLSDDDSHSLNNEQHFTRLFQSLELARVFEERLRKWKEALPYQLQASFINNNKEKSGFLSDSKQVTITSGYLNANATLQISYYVILLGIQKALLRKFSNKYMSINSGEDMKTNLLLSNLKDFEQKFNDIKFHAIKVSIDCFRTIKALKVSDLNGFWYLFINFKFVFIANFFILLHMVIDKTVEELNPSLPISTTDLSQTSYYNNNLQFKSTLQKIIIDFKICVKNRSSKWKYTRLANDFLNQFKGFDDIDILEHYSDSFNWTNSTGSAKPETISKNSSSAEFEYKLGHFELEMASSFNTTIGPEPLSLDEEMPKYELLNYEEKFLLV